MTRRMMRTAHFRRRAHLRNLSPVPGVTSHGVYGAVNTLTGKVAWTIPVLTTAPDSGVAVAGDLVFFGDSTGLFYAANAATGEILWVFDASTVPNAGGATASPAIYEVNGVEYVVYGFGGNPGESPVLGDAVIAFALPIGDRLIRRTQPKRRFGLLPVVGRGSFL